MAIRRTCLFSLLAALGGPAIAAPHAAPCVQDEVVLTSGERLRGTIRAVSDSSLTLDHAVLGTLTIPRDGVESFRRDNEPPAADASAPPVDPSAPAAVPTDVPPPGADMPPDEPDALPQPTSWLRGWKGAVNLGANGSEGNSDNLSLRGVVTAKRTTERLETTGSIGYVYAADAGTTSTSRGEAFIRNDWNIPDSRWGYFAQAKAEYDEFQDWDWRLSTSAGPSYQLVKTDSTSLRLRAGAGAAYEIGGDDEGLEPELLAGADFEHKFTERTRFFASAEFFPSLSDWPQHRANASAGLEVLLDPDSKTNLKVGVTDRYSSDPGANTRRNDVDFFVTLGWEF
ncbi:MAG: DUF481 domain-containing protein [Planctomycetota bacterium]|nr:DUF481 domain-containing protein [Planctomycetota bacterium]